MDILGDEDFILGVLFMTIHDKQTTNYKIIFRVMLVIFITSITWRGYLKVSSIFMEKNISAVNQKITKEQKRLASFSDKPGFDKYQYIKTLEKDDNMMPRSDHINAIIEIFNELLSVDHSDTFNIYFSDFKISLKEVSFNGHVSNLRLLYKGATSDKPGLIEKFENLDFLDNISISTYEKSSDDLGYDFTLTANVTNNGK